MFLAPNQKVDAHFTTTLDYDFVHAGEVRLLLGDDELVLRPGDGVMIPGVEHGWAAGPEGSVMSVVTLGFAAPD